MTLGERLKYARKTLNLTLNDVESRTQIAVSTLSEFENNRREPKLVQLKSLADLYRRSVAFFLEEGEMVPEVVLWRERPTTPRARNCRPNSSPWQSSTTTWRSGARIARRSSCRWKRAILRAMTTRMPKP